MSYQAVRRAVEARIKALTPAKPGAKRYTPVRRLNAEEIPHDRAFELVASDARDVRHITDFPVHYVTDFTLTIAYKNTRDVAEMEERMSADREQLIALIKESHRIDNAIISLQANQESGIRAIITGQTQQITWSYRHS